MATKLSYDAWQLCYRAMQVLVSGVGPIRVRLLTAAEHLARIELPSWLAARHEELLEQLGRGQESRSAAISRLTEQEASEVAIAIFEVWRELERAYRNSSPTSPHPRQRCAQ